MSEIRQSGHVRASNGLGSSQHAVGMEGSSVGGDLKLEKDHIQSFTIGGFDLGAMEVLLSSDTAGSLSSRAEAGNVGNSILSRFVVTFDFRSGRIFFDRDIR